MPYTVTPTHLPEVLILQPKVFGDARGFFYESYNARDFEAATGLKAEFVQDNHSLSSQGVLRGLHYQIQHAQGKLVRVVQGEVLDTETATQLWVPPGFAHGFLVLSKTAEFLYKTTDYWYPEHERSLLWNDPALGIEWPLPEGFSAPVLAAKDAAALPLAQAETF